MGYLGRRFEVRRRWPLIDDRSGQGKAGHPAEV